MLKGIGIAALVLAGGFILLMAAAPRDNRPPADRIADACRREFPYRTDLQNACIIAAASKMVDETNAAKMERVMRETR